MITKKHALRFCNGQKRTPLLDLRKCIKTRSFLSFPVLLCSRHGRRNCSKSSKIHHKMITKNATPGLAMVRNAGRRTTYKNTSKRVHMYRSRCCFAHAMNAKIIQNYRKSSMGACKVSTVVPAARRANSKCIITQKR